MTDERPALSLHEIVAPGSDAASLAPAAALLNRAADLLEKRAAEATQGEDQDLYDNPGWSADEDPGCLSVEDGDRVTPLVRACGGEIVAACESRADADLIATMNPHVVTAVASAFRDMAKALEVQERVRLNNPGEPFRLPVMFGLTGLTAAAELLLLREEGEGD